MTEIDLFTALGNVSESINSQFEFWIATSFAVVIASYTAGPNLTKYVRAGAALLYIMASTIFFIRILDSIDLAGRIAQELDAMDSILGTEAIPLASTLRTFLMLSGTLLVTGLIVWPRIFQTGRKDH